MAFLAADFAYSFTRRFDPSYTSGLATDCDQFQLNIDTLLVVSVFNAGACFIGVLPSCVIAVAVAIEAALLQLGLDVLIAEGGCN